MTLQAENATLPPSNGANVNVRDFGAIGDGKTDDTGAFQRALDFAATKGQVVFAPPAQYRMDGRLSVPSGVTLRGVWESVPSHNGLRDRGLPRPTDDGTTFLVTGDKGKTEGAFITLNTNSVLRGVCLYYPDQNPQSPVPYPYALALRGKSPAVLDVELLNPYYGIDASQNERHLIRNVSGQPLRLGIYVDAVYDVGRIENVHFNPWWNASPALMDWQRQHGEAFVFGRSDWQSLLNTFCYGYGIGYKFIKTRAGHGRSNGSFVGIGADGCHVCVHVEASAPEGLLITNGQFVAMNGPDPTAVVVTATNGGTVRFSACCFFGPSRQTARLAGKGTTAFSDCSFVYWDNIAPDRYAIYADDGRLFVRGCEFWGNKPHIALGPKVEQAVISDNMATAIEGKGGGPLRVRNQSRGKVRIRHD